MVSVPVFWNRPVMWPSLCLIRVSSYRISIGIGALVIFSNVSSAGISTGVFPVISKNFTLNGISFSGASGTCEIVFE